MRVWRRATHAMLCGFCGEAIRRGDPVLFLVLPDIARKRLRCVDCTSEAVPDLPPLEDEKPGVVETTGQRALMPIGQLAADWKAKQAGGDE